jgi:hypothetical protein
LCSKLLFPSLQRRHRRKDFVCASPSSRSDAPATGVWSDLSRLPKAAGIWVVFRFASPLLKPAYRQSA